MKKLIQKIKTQTIKPKSDKKVAEYFSLGKMSAGQAKAVLVIFALIFAGYLALLNRYYYQQLIKAIPQPKAMEIMRKEYMENKIKELVKGTPIEIMAPYIAEKDKKTAAFLIGIARKESNWGKRKPVLNGEDCFNYWGYRGLSETMGSGGHTCFGSPEEAVSVVAKRVEQIIKRNDVKSAKNMIVWKCGYSCAAHSAESVDKWIKDVDMYAKQIMN